jgi:hypothetical protein
MDIREIITRKKEGIDCTENESAEIKGWLRECGKMMEEIKNLFPLEFSEFIENMENEGK